MKKKYHAAIIGAGNIGAFYSLPDDYNGILTHAHAYKIEKRTELVAFVDVDYEKAQKAARVWKARPYKNPQEMFKKEKIDIVSVCAPDEIHKNILKDCLKHKLKAVFCEKPLTTDIQSGERLVKEYSQAGILLAVNYTRRFNKDIINLKKKINKNEFGQPLNIIGIYAKGILHSGSHLIDLLRYFFGEIAQAIPLGVRIDWEKADPTIDAFLKFNSGVTAHIVAADDRHYSMLDLDLIFQKNRLQLTEFGSKITLYKLKQSRFRGGSLLLHPVSVKEIKLNRTIINAVTNIVNTLEGKEKLLCPGIEALKTQKVCHQLIETFKTKENSYGKIGH